MITYKTVCGSPSEVPIPVDMVWDEATPMAVTFTFFQGHSKIRWDFALSLLTDLMEDGLAGEGDVRFIAIDEEIFMTISSTDGTTSLVFDSVSIVAFVEEVECSDTPEMEITDEAIYGWLDEAA